MLVVAGLVPTMVYLTVSPCRSLKVPFHWVRVVAGASGASSVWFGPALNIGFASRILGYLGSFANPTLAHASTKNAASKLARGRHRVIRSTLLGLGKPVITRKPGMTNT